MAWTAVLNALVLLSLTTTSPMAAAGQSLIGICPVPKPEICPMIYDPVFGVPTFRTHGNSCVACAEGAWFWVKLPWSTLGS